MIYTFADLLALWAQVSGDPQHADTAAAVALAESKGNPDAVDNTRYPSRPGYHKPGPGAQPEYSVGLWQINMLAHPNYTVAQLLNPRGNALAAEAVSKDGSNWSPWSTYKSGAYLAYLPGGLASQPGSSGGTQLDTTQFSQAWTRLMRVFALTGPEDLKRVSSARARIRKAVR